MNAGALKRVVEHRRFPRTADGQGGWTLGAPTVINAALRVSLYPAKPANRLLAQQMRADYTHDGQAMPDAGLVARDELREGTRTFEVVGVQLIPGPPGFLSFTALERQKEPQS